MLAVNQESLAGVSHAEAIAVFRSIRTGKVVLHIVRRNTPLLHTNDQKKEVTVEAEAE